VKRVLPGTPAAPWLQRAPAVATVNQIQREATTVSSRSSVQVCTSTRQANIRPSRLNSAWPPPRAIPATIPPAALHLSTTPHNAQGLEFHRPPVLPQPVVPVPMTWPSSLTPTSSIHCFLDSGSTAASWSTKAAAGHPRSTKLQSDPAYQTAVFSQRPWDLHQAADTATSPDTATP